MTLEILRGGTDPAEIITSSFGGKTFRASRRTFAHLAWTQERLDKQHPGARIVVIQGAYNTTIKASAGTHDYDAALDVAIVGLDWWEAQRFLRQCGWAAWYRYLPPWQDDEHVHMISLGYPGRVGVFIPGQVDDYRRHALGLKGQHNSGSDTSWSPEDIDSTTFNYPAWLRDQEEDMPYTDWPERDRKALADDVARAVLDAKVGERTVRASIRMASNAPALLRELGSQITTALATRKK